MTRLCADVTLLRRVERMRLADPQERVPAPVEKSVSDSNSLWSRSKERMTFETTLVTMSYLPAWLCPDAPPSVPGEPEAMNVVSRLLLIRTMRALLKNPRIHFSGSHHFAAPLSIAPWPSFPSGRESEGGLAARSQPEPAQVKSSNDAAIQSRDTSRLSRF